VSRGPITGMPFSDPICNILLRDPVQHLPFSRANHVCTHEHSVLDTILGWT
jgi:hypothetical protein